MPLIKQQALGSGPRLPLLVSLFALFGSALPGFAQTAADDTANDPLSAPRETRQTFTSKNFVLHTDLSEIEAGAVLVRLETTLVRISSYWGRRPHRPIECYVVEDFSNWNDSDFPHEFARALIAGIGGGTCFESHSRKNSKPKATVYSSTRLGVVEHEAVHAYCGQTFGATGPDWYKEGMAEMAFHGRAGKMEVECDANVVRFLRRSRRPSIRQITNSGRMNLHLAQSLLKVLNASSSDTVEQKKERIRDWCRENGDAVQSSRESYRWCWALCHFMSHNPNYAKRFRLLGRGYLTPKMRDGGDLFSNLFGPMQREIEFEYGFFLDRIGIGYRVDLCRWDWKSKFRSLEAGDSKSSRIKAAFGYQPSGLNVQKDRRYAFECSGTWQIECEGNALDADGNKQRLGRLEGVIMSDYELSEPFDLGQSGTFLAPADGKLFLRCRDRWTELGDNSGSVLVKVTNQGIVMVPFDSRVWNAFVDKEVAREKKQRPRIAYETP